MGVGGGRSRMGDGICWGRAVVDSADAAYKGAVDAGIAAGAGGDAISERGADSHRTRSVAPGAHFLTPCKV